MEFTENGLSEKSKYFLLILVMLFFMRHAFVVTTGSFLLYFSKEELTEQQVTTNLVRVVRHYRPKMGVQCIAYSNKNKGEPIIGIEAYELVQTMTDEERYLMILGGGSSNNLDPVEVYGIFACHLFLQDRVYPVKILAIAWYYNSGGLDNTRDQVTSITPEEFESVLEQVDIEGLARTEAAKALGDYWIQETGYVKLD